jgi:hypothetical protein
LQYQTGKYEISRRENRCVLRIKDASPDDEAEYACEVDGDTTTCAVKVEGKVMVIGKILIETQYKKNHNDKINAGFGWYKTKNADLSYLVWDGRL